MFSVGVSSGRVREIIPALPGIGLGLPHHKALIAQRPRVAWFEVHGEIDMSGGAAIRLPYGRVRFVQHPSVRLLSVRYPADAIWRAVLRRRSARSR